MTAENEVEGGNVLFAIAEAKKELFKTISSALDSTVLHIERSTQHFDNYSGIGVASTEGSVYFYACDSGGDTVFKKTVDEVFQEEFACWLDPCTYHIDDAEEVYESTVATLTRCLEAAHKSIAARRAGPAPSLEVAADAL